MEPATYKSGWEAGLHAPTAPHGDKVDAQIYTRISYIGYPETTATIRHVANASNRAYRRTQNKSRPETVDSGLREPKMTGIASNAPP